MSPRPLSPELWPTANSPKTGKPIAVIKNPISAERKFPPLSRARNGGKIRLPAPKNMLNIVKAINSFFFISSLFIIHLFLRF